MSFVVSLIFTGGNLLQLTRDLPFATINVLLAYHPVCCARPAILQPHQGEKEMTPLAILGVLSSAIFSGTSLLYATLGEIVDERAGIVNLGLEGVLLVGAARESRSPRSPAILTWGSWLPYWQGD